MTSRDLLSHSNVLDEIAEMSYYEDALDLSDSELQKLCNDTVRHLRYTRRSQVGNINYDNQEGISSANSPRPTQPNIQSSSSGDNSSIERISYGRRSNVSETQNNGQNSNQSRSRQPTGSRRRNAQRSNTSSNGNGDWRMINSMDYSYFPTLFQIDKQLQVISVQLREMQFSNSLQLQLIYRLTKIFMASKKRKWPANGVSFSVWIMMFVWPLLIQLVYYFYKKNQHSFLTFMDII